MNSSRPKTSAILAQLKDFQRTTVDYVFQRMYLDEDYARRFLIADEVGLGKTLVARGLIAKVIERLWDRSPRIDIIYVCSNTDIARQNINRLNVTGHDDFALSSRITLLPVTIQSMEDRRVNFVSFTPGTSFDVGNSPGWSYERELLYWLLAEAWDFGFAKATSILHATAKVDGFRQRVKGFPRESIHRGIAQRFAARLCERTDLRNYAVTAVMRSRRRLTQHQVQLESHAGGPRMTRNSA